MRHRITELAPFRIVGRKGRIPLKYEGENPAIVDFHTSIPEGTGDRLRTVADLDEFPDILSVSTNFADGREDGSEFDYYYSVATRHPVGDLNPDWNVLEVPESTWAVFEADSRDGHLREALQSLWADAFSEWFPSNPYRIIPGPEILSTTEQSDDGMSGRGELWIPVARD